MSNNKIMQFSYLLREQKIKRAGKKTALFHAGIAITAKVRDAPRKLHHGLLFAPPLSGSQVRADVAVA